MLVDNHGRTIDYLRLAVTDRCNLRCFYCMPAEGIEYVQRPELLTYEEMFRLVSVLAKMGIRKLRITGGEPFLRKDMMQFLRSIARDTDLAIHITTNGTLTAPLIPELKKLGIASINLSLDTLDRERFHSITRRDDLPKVLDTFAQLQHHGIPTKINMVVMNGRNTDDIVEMARLARDHQVSVRFIEEMPFNGSGAHTFVWDHGMILQRLRTAFPDLTAVPRKHGETAQRYRSKDFKGTLGIIAAYSRTFCGTCNRLRITPVGTLRTCLYDDGIFNVRDLMRAGSTDAELKDAFLSAIGARAKNGFEAEAKRLNDRVGESMATIGG